MSKFKSKLARSLLSISHHNRFRLLTRHTIINPPINRSKPSINHSIKHPWFPNSFPISTVVGNESESEPETLVLSKDSVKRCELKTEIELLMNIITQNNRNCITIRNHLEKCSVAISPELVTEVLSRTRNDWELAFTFFLWAGNQPNYAHSTRQYHSMIAILGKSKRFDAAWKLIDEMKTTVTTQTLLIMIRRYSAVHDVRKAVNTFHAYKRFGFESSIDEFYDLLSALCRYKNVKEAESLLINNKHVYAMSTKSFNIILNGWCNIIGSPREGKRIWWEMSNRGIVKDVISYSSIITCYSKCSETSEVMKIFDELLATDINPDRKVYNAVIHSLAKSGLTEKARELMKSMEANGISPNAITYNSLLMPLCKKGKMLDARKVFDEMLERGLLPTVRTYHVFLRAAKTCDETVLILAEMNAMRCFPTHETYVMLIKKFCRWREMENVWRIWDEMISNGLDHDRCSYVALVNGLFLNGMLEEAYKFYTEMKAKGLVPEPEIENRMEAWIAGKQT